LSVVDSGASFKACVSLALTTQFQSWLQNMPSEPEKQMQLMVERRLLLSKLAHTCGGQHMFAAAAAATVHEYIKWVKEELQRDDGNTSKVLARSMHLN